MSMRKLGAYPDCNVYGVAYREGIAYVADAGGNTVLAIDVASGEITTFAVTGGLDAPMLPNGMAFDASGSLLLTHKASFAPEGGGELVRTSGVVEAAGTPFTVPAPPA